MAEILRPEGGNGVDMHPLESEGFLEDLVNDGRVPSVMRWEHKESPDTPSVIKHVVYVPPEGYEKTDDYEFTSKGILFWTKDGERRGYATGYDMTEEQVGRFHEQLGGILDRQRA